MKVTRETTEVLNDPLLILNTHRAVFYTAVVVCLGLALKWRWDYSAGIFVAACFLSQWLAKYDRDALALIPACFEFQQACAYDPYVREPFTLVILEDDSEKEY
ncbi:MAG: hypothetical protein ACJ73N_05625 [Bryobacteraceae bacterium]